MDDKAGKQEIWDPGLILPAEFQLLEALGEGGYGSVYKAVHLTMSKNVAIKFIRKESFANEGELLKYFQKEVKAIAGLEHPNIVRVLQVGICSDGTPFLVFEFLEGETLKSYLERHKTLSAGALICLFCQLLSALEYAHSLGVIHRDIKPANIVLMPEQANSSIFHVKLLDFGTARTRALSVSQAAATSATSSLCGSPVYMSPEQCRGEATTERSDIYSLACLLYECLIGQPPFSGDTPIHTLYKQINEQAPLPDKRLPKRLNDLLSSCLAKDPSRRISDCKELSKQLQAALKDLEQWSKSSQFDKFKVIVPIALLLVLVIGFLSVQHEYSKNSAAGLSKKTASDKHSIQFSSPETRLARVSKIMVDPSFSSKDSPRLIEELDKLIPHFTRKNDLLFVSYTFKATCQRFLGKHAEEKDSLERALACCKLANGKLSRESCQCFMFLAENAFAQKSYVEAESYAFKSLGQWQKIQKTELQDLGIDKSYDCVDITRAFGRNNFLLARVCLFKHDPKAAEKYARLALSAVPASSTPVYDYAERMLLAEVYGQMGKNALAISELDVLSKAIRAPGDKSLRVNGFCGNNLIEASLEAANGYAKYGEKEKARQSYRDAREFCLLRKEVDRNFVHNIELHIKSLAEPESR